MDNTVTQGSNQFFNVGCARCHTVTLQPAGAHSLGWPVSDHPYSDFAIHHMGPGLADGISQGGAGPDEFRTAPFWGLGQRLFFLHDGRTSDLLQAIRAHSSPTTSPTAVPVDAVYQPSEAAAAVKNFFNLSSSDQQAVLNFLRSL